MVQKESFPAAG